MSFRTTIQGFWQHFAYSVLFLALTSVSCWGQQSGLETSSRKGFQQRSQRSQFQAPRIQPNQAQAPVAAKPIAPKAILAKAAPSKADLIAAATATLISTAPTANNKTTRATMLEPIADPIKPTQTASAKPQTRQSKRSPIRLPKLADPEQFKVQSAKTNRSWTNLQDQPGGLPTLKEVQQQSRSLVAQDAAAGSMVKSLPATSLHGGISNNPMQRAVFNRDIADPNLTFANLATLGQDYAPNYQPATKTWRSPNMVHRPLYFEDENLERYGNSRGGPWQPVFSGVKFFTAIPLMPYKTGKTPVTDCEYSMGHLRPGDCNPAYKKCFDFSRRGAVYQALGVGAVVAGL